MVPIIPTTWEAEAGALLEARSKTSLANIGKPHLYLKKKNSWLWWDMIAIPGTQRLRQEKII